MTFRNVFNRHNVVTTLRETYFYDLKSSILSTFSILCLWAISKALYNAYFHPLARFPGPILARSSLIWRMRHSMSGHLHLAIQKQHQKYGPVIRLSPNELSFASVTSLKTIYGHQPSGRAPALKTEHYDMLGAGFGFPSIGSERDPHKHNGMKKSLAAALSPKAVKDQEHVVSDLVDKFNMRLEEFGPHSTIDLTKWFDFLTLDILGALAFSKSFGCLDEGNASAWPRQMISYMYFATLADNLRQLPFIGTIMKALFKSSLPKHAEHSLRSREKVAERLYERPTQGDFFTKFVEQFDNGEIEKEQLAAHAATLVVGGSETTSTFLSATTYHLLKAESVFTKLKDEIRGAFINYSEINATASQNLPYLQAVIAEGLRMYPPLSLGFPRESPGMVVDEQYIPKGTEVSTSYWTVTHDEKNFLNPYQFDPERWLDPSSKDIKEASQPFSLGPRACSGRAFAYMELSLTLAKMFWKYDLELVEPDFDWVRASRIYLLWVRPDLQIRCVKREGV